MKTYIGFANDHSGSMHTLKSAALSDYNSLIKSIKDASTKEEQDTVVSSLGFGLSSCYGHELKWDHRISNPHVLKPKTEWDTRGNTPLYDAIGEMVNFYKGLPDANEIDTSFLIFITTDGGENGSRKFTQQSVRDLLDVVQKTGRWTFVFRVPKGLKFTVSSLGVPEENILEWETTSRGMLKAAVTTQNAIGSFYAARSAGATSSTVFYANAQNVDLNQLQDVTKETSLYVVDPKDTGIEIRDFILKHRQQYLKGAAFYQLTKTEPRVQHTKMIAIRDRSNGKVYVGDVARKMIGLPINSNARLHPGDHGNYDLFIQSESVNRKLVGGTGVLYYAKIGVPFKEADLAYLKPKVNKPAVVELPKVVPTNKPTKSPIPKKVRGLRIATMPVRLFPSREAARQWATAHGKRPMDLKNQYGQAIHENIPSDARWFVFE